MHFLACSGWGCAECLERCYFEQFCRLVHLGHRVLSDPLPWASDLANGWMA